MGVLDPEKLKGQVRDVLRAADAIVAADCGQAGPDRLRPEGRLPARPRADRPRGKRYPQGLPDGAAILVDQPEHLPDYYLVLIVHALGHVLLHLKDSGREYRRFRKLIRERVSLAPDFFPSSTSCWTNSWNASCATPSRSGRCRFNRLDFYIGRIPLSELKAFLAQRPARPGRSGRGPGGARAGQGLRRPRRPFAVIQSAAVFSEGLNFSRLYAFYAVLRDRLPLSTGGEEWFAPVPGVHPEELQDAGCLRGPRRGRGDLQDPDARPAGAGVPDHQDRAHGRGRPRGGAAARVASAARQKRSA